MNQLKQELDTIKKLLKVPERTPAQAQKLFELCSGMAFFQTFLNKVLDGPEKDAAVGVDSL